MLLGRFALASVFLLPVSLAFSVVFPVPTSFYTCPFYGVYLSLWHVRPPRVPTTVFPSPIPLFPDHFPPLTYSYTTCPAHPYHTTRFEAQTRVCSESYNPPFTSSPRPNTLFAPPPPTTETLTQPHATPPHPPPHPHYGELLSR